jgi:hypothetical protein
MHFGITTECVKQNKAEMFEKNAQKLKESQIHEMP